MPRICEFFGIKIYMYFREHHPAHFHAEYAGEEAWVDINQLTVMRGRLPPRATGLVIEWATLHQRELKRAWVQAVAQKKIDKIEPLR